MISSKEFKYFKLKAIEKLKIILVEESFFEYKFYDETPKIKGQYWYFEFSIFEENDDSYSDNCGYFRCPKLLTSEHVSINQFFDNNDLLFDEFARLNELNQFNELNSISNKIVDIQDGLIFNLSISSSFNSNNTWKTNILEEHVLSFGPDYNNNREINLFRDQYSREWIATTQENTINHFSVPFDKVCFFNNAVKVKTKTNNMRPFSYQIGLSFAGEDRVYVEKIAKELKKRKIKVFYDKFEQDKLWGKDLYEHLDNIYQNECRYCIMFISESYSKKLWTSHERKSAQARSFKDKEEYILPIKLDNTDIPGINLTIGYLNSEEHSIEEIADIIQKKLANNFA